MEQLKSATPLTPVPPRVMNAFGAATVSGLWLAAIDDGLAHLGAHDLVVADSATTRECWSSADHERAMLVALANSRGALAVRTLGRHIARLALTRLDVAPSSRAGCPFDTTLTTLWNATHRDCGELSFVDLGLRHAIVDVRGARTATDDTWCEVWLGMQEGVLRHLRHSGCAQLVRDERPPATVRTRTIWAGALSGTPTFFR
jgi:hypothetical protein